MPAWRPSAAIRLRHATLLRPLLSVGKVDVPWQVGLRNTAAVVVPLALGAATDQLPVGLAVAVGALNTMFVDQAGPYRLRMQAMALTAMAAGMAAFAGATLGEVPAVLPIVALVWAFLAALLVAVGPSASRAGMTSMVLLAVMSADPQPVPQALAVALLIAAGGALQMLFAIAAWPLQRYRPERHALAGAFRALATVARQPVASGSESALPPSLNALQATLFGAGHARGRAVEALRVLAQLGERIRLELSALADLQTRDASTPAASPLQAVRQAAAEVLDALASALEQTAAPRADAALAAFATAVAPLTTMGSADTGATSWVAMAGARATALGGQLRAAVRNADAAGSRGEIRAQTAEFRLPRTLRPANPLETLRANLHLHSPACRHAIRAAICFSIAIAWAHTPALTRGYWLPMTMAIVLRPDFGATWRIGLLRVLGTLVGLVLFTGLLHFIGIDNVWVALALLAVSCFGFRELAAVHYGVAVTCLTGLVVILLTLYGVPPEASLPARLIDTAAGSALALFAYFAWPTWERGREQGVLAELLDAYREYLLAVTGGNRRACHETRIAARAARSAAEASLDRMRHEPASRASVPRAQALMAQANRVVRATMTLESARGTRDAVPEPPNAHLVDGFVDALAHALAECAAALREARAPVDDWQLRQRQRAFAATLAADGHVEWTAALLDASDRIVDAIDSVAHVLQR